MSPTPHAPLPIVETPGEDRPACFVCLWASQTLSLFGSMVTQFAMNVWLVRDLYPAPEQHHELALALSVVGIAGFAPLVFSMPLAGAFADRHDRRRILIVSNTVLALLSALLVVLTTRHALTLPVAAVLLALYATTSSFHSAAFDSSYGLFVAPRHLARAGGMMQTSQALSQMLAPALAATLIALPTLLRQPAWLPPGLEHGVPFAFAADGLTFVIAAGVALRLRFPALPPQPARTTGLIEDMRAGFRWILSRRPFRWLLAVGALANFTFAPLLLLLPLLARDRVAADAARLGLTFEEVFAIAHTAGGAGGVLGGVLVSAWGLPRARRTLIMAGCLATLALGEVLAGAATTVWALAAAMFVGELLVAPLNTASYTLWQSLTPSHMLARALSTRRFIAQGAFPLGTAVSGWIATRFDPWVVVLGAGALLLLGILVQVTRPGFATLEERMREAAQRVD